MSTKYYPTTQAPLPIPSKSKKTAGTIIRRQAALIHPRVLPLIENITKSPMKSKCWINVHQWYGEVKEKPGKGEGLPPPTAAPGPFASPESKGVGSCRATIRRRFARGDFGDINSYLFR
jgi:hypothetical protein